MMVVGATRLLTPTPGKSGNRTSGIGRISPCGTCPVCALIVQVGGDSQRRLVHPPKMFDGHLWIIAQCCLRLVSEDFIQESTGDIFGYTQIVESRTLFFLCSILGLSQKHFIREAVVFHAWNCKLHEVASGWETIEIFIDCLIPAVHPLLSREIQLLQHNPVVRCSAGLQYGRNFNIQYGLFRDCRIRVIESLASCVSVLVNARLHPVIPSTCKDGGPTSA